MNSNGQLNTLNSVYWLNHDLLSKSNFRENYKENDGRVSYLRLYVDTDTSALVPMSKIQEVAVLPSRLLTTMPSVSPYMLGLINRRGKIMWVLDLSQMMGLKRMEFIPRTYSALVIKVGTFLSALAVHKIDGILRIDKNMISMTPNYISSTLIPYLEGCLLQDKSVSLVLDIEAIAQSHLLQINS